MSKIRALRWFFKQPSSSRPVTAQGFWWQTINQKNTKGTPICMRGADVRRHARTPTCTSARLQPKVTNGSKEGENKALTPRPCYEPDARLTGVKMEPDQKRVVLFIAFKSELARTQPLCDDESGTSGDERSHTGRGANTDFH